MPRGAATGCSFGCSYCYAVFMCRYNNRAVADWGRFVQAKGNLGELLSRRLRRLDPTRSVFLSSVTDPYQPPERALGLTGTALQLLARARHRGTVMVMTKSPLVTRDIDLLTELNQDVGLSLAPCDQEMRRHLEPGVPSLTSRLVALERLNRAGLRTYAFVGPIFPHLVLQPRRIEELLLAIREAGTTEVYLAWFNVRPDARRRLLHLLGDAEPELVRRFYLRPTDAPKRRLEPLVRAMIDKVGLTLRTREIIDH